jgi:predicted transcriptional regulator
MATTIQISEELKKELAAKKLYTAESYEDVIWDLMEDTMELSEQTKRNIAQARKEIERGEFITHKQLKKELGL